ncbi:protein FAM110C [Mesocricetus auratus]|uniref:Protein FAM110C n=1 Tax=Mesocricetus auratus TaxID=10036 RepID=A0A1U7QMH2_MESAU|nr:protein FAM110C [Mesocricetus auratus]
MIHLSRLFWLAPTPDLGGGALGRVSTPLADFGTDSDRLAPEQESSLLDDSLVGSDPAKMRALPAMDALARMRPPLRDPRAAEETHTARPASKSAVERLAADRAKYVRSTPGSSQGPVSECSVPETPGVQHRNPIPSALAPAPVARRALSRKSLRPDSLVIYRQKCEFVRGPGADCSRGGLVKKLFQGSAKDKMPVAPETTGASGEEDKTKDTETTWTKFSQAAATSPASVLPPPAPVVTTESPDVPLQVASKVPVANPGTELQVSRRRGLQRSQSDLSSRYSVARAEPDTFFLYCGLDPEVVEAIGRENFSAGSDCVTLKVRSVSMATSDSSFSRHSDDGLQEEELMEQVPSTTSVVERNARIIKWLFTCKKAKETPSQRLQGPA